MFELAAFMTFYRLLMGTQHTVSLVWAWSGLEFRRWGEGKKNAIIPLDLMLNQWHFKDKRAGSHQCVVMSYSEAEAPQWRSLCWEQRCEHFSIIVLFGFSFVCLFASKIHFCLSPIFQRQSSFSSSQHARSIFPFLGGHPEPQRLLERCGSAGCSPVGAGGQGCPPRSQESCVKAFIFHQ